MKNNLKEKTINVIKSCNNKVQLLSAGNYLLLAIKTRKLLYSDYCDLIDLYMQKKIDLLK